MNKYIEDKSETKYIKLEASVSKNITSNSISKNTRSYWEATKKFAY